MAKRTGIMLPQSFTEALFNRIPKPCIVQPKLEGDRLRVEPCYGNALLKTSSAKPRVSVPHIKLLLANAQPLPELDGELYVHGMRHSDIRRIVGRSKNLHPDYLKMEYHVYDIVSEDDQVSRLRTLHDLVVPECVKKVPWYWINSMEEFQSIYDQFLMQGYEGIIVRHPDRPYSRRKVQWMLKLKPRLSGEYEIVGMEEEMSMQGEPKGRMGAFILRDTEGEEFNVGTGPIAEDRVMFWTMREDMMYSYCKIRFQNYTKARHVPKMQSIDKEWLSEQRRRFS